MYVFNYLINDNFPREHFINIAFSDILNILRKKNVYNASIDNRYTACHYSNHTSYQQSGVQECMGANLNLKKIGGCKL